MRTEFRGKLFSMVHLIKLRCCFLFVLLFICTDIIAQDESIYLSGQVVDQATKKPLKGAHLFNLNTIIGTSTSSKGKYEIPVIANDTLFISHLGFESIKIKITNDLLKGNELVIELVETSQLIKTVEVKTHQLVGVLEIDAKNVPEDKYTRIHIVGLPQTYEVGVKERPVYNSPIHAIINPVDFLYNLFGSKPKQLRKLKKLRDDGTLRAQFEKINNRGLLMEYLRVDESELNDLLNECNYSDYFIKESSDLQLIEAVLLCYENYKALKKGSTERDRGNKE